MRKYAVAPAGVFVVVFVLMCLAGCKDPLIEDNSLIGSGENDMNLSHIDTFSVSTATVRTSPDFTKLVSASVGVLGSSNNTVYGKTWASMYTEFEYNTTLPDVSGATVDSCVISLPYYIKNARCNTPTDVVVYQLSQRMNKDESYASDDALPVYSNPLGVVYNYTPNLTDSVKELGVSQKPQLRIPLSNSFAQNILSNAANIKDETTFKNTINGFYLTTNTAKFLNGFVYLYMNQAKMTIYYHTATLDSQKIDFINSSASARFIHYDHSFGGSQLETALNNSSTGEFFTLNGGGVKTNISISGLDSIQPNSIAIAKAQLIVYGAAKNFVTDSIPEPNFLKLYYVINDSTQKEIIDYRLPVYQRFGVPSITKETVNGVSYNKFTFDVSVIMQSIIDKKINFVRFELRSPSFVNNETGEVNYLTPDRFVGINDRNNPDLKARLKISYLKLNK